jgi:hypothetical protein
MQKLDTNLHTTLVSLSDAASGFSASEVTGYSPEQVRRAANALAADGQIVRSKVTPRSVRYFKTDKLARQYIAGNAVAARPRSAGGPRSKAPWRPEDPAVITARTKIYVAPPLPHRVYRTNTYLQF